MGRLQREVQGFPYKGCNPRLGRSTLMSEYEGFAR